jgi:deoxyribose-phosphate aldolase
MNIAKYIDHTLLKPDATPADIEKLCQEAEEFGFAAVCVNPSHVLFCRRFLKDTGVKVCTVIGFPLGATSTESKMSETTRAINDGAEEIDMVIPIGHLKAGDFDYVRNDIAAVVMAANSRATVKVIIETSLLTDEEKVSVCRLAVEAKADYVKTSTGFGGGGATVKDVRLMKETVGDKAKVKASGGIKTKEDAEAMIEAGAERLGTSSGIDIIK